MSSGDDLPIDAHVAAGGRVTYIYADGHTLTLHGSHPYRDNNPGNLSYAGKTGESRARVACALTVDPTPPYKFAVFPSVDAGEQALSRMIADRKSDGITVGRFMSRYAPKGANNLTAYLAAVVKAVGSGATKDTLLSSLSDAQTNVLKETIRVHEGWRSARRELSPPVQVSAPPKR